MTRLQYLWLLATLAFAGCAESASSETLSCVPGAPVACTCPGGRASTGVCLDGGDASSCSCGSSGAACQPAGGLLPCTCPDGGNGSQACLVDGSLGRCRCEGAVQPEPSLDDAEVDEDPVPAQSLPQRCCHGLGACFHADIVGAEAGALFQSRQCVPAEDMLCVPDELANPAGFELQACHSIGGVEGRCLVDCLAGGEELAGLPRDLCPAHHRCAPCFDPFTGEDSGLCYLSRDRGPRGPAVVFDACCDGRGTCVPTTLVPDAQRALLGSAGCDPDAASLCSPDALLDPGGFVPASCRGTGGLEGRCLSTCLPLVAGQQQALSQGQCPTGDACVPCFDPFSGKATGVCDFPGDPGPVDPPMPFARCCNDLGTCVPSSIVPQDERALLGPDSCRTDDDLCAPDALLEPDGFVAPACIGPGNQEGRCLPDCLPLVAEQGGLLARGSCEDFHACVPCYEPLSGEPTGVCAFPGDPGPLLPPMPFDRCCQDTGVCVPQALVPDDQRGMLGADTCDPRTPSLCTPDVALQPGYVPAMCTGGGQLEGRCLSTCLPMVSDQAGLLTQGDCDDVQACMPCYDPFSGEPTGVCSFPGDPGPQQPPMPFAKCCEIAGVQEGTCIPLELVPGDQADTLPQDSCASNADRCVHGSLLRDPPIPAPPCAAGLLGEGRCLRECMVEGALAALVSQQDCQVNDVCVPCAIFGNPTGVCQAP